MHNFTLQHFIFHVSFIHHFSILLSYTILIDFQVVPNINTNNLTFNNLNFMHHFINITHTHTLYVCVCVCCDIAVAQINYPSLKHNTQDSIEQARGQSHEEGSSQIFMLDDM
jgi:hypothetical protein